jgi:hypothetical protein
MKPTTALRVITVATQIEAGCWLGASGMLLSLAAFAWATLIY